jgi:hypothetical protein
MNCESVCASLAWVEWVWVCLHALCHHAGCGTQPLLFICDSHLTLLHMHDVNCIITPVHTIQPATQLKTGND